MPSLVGSEMCIRDRSQPITAKASQASARSLLPPNTNSQSNQFAGLPSASSQSGNRFPAPAGAPASGFSSPQVNKSPNSGAGFGRSNATRPAQPKSFGGSGLNNSSVFGSSNTNNGTGASPSTIRRQPSSSSSSFSGLSNSSQSSIGGQPKRTPLRGCLLYTSPSPRD